MDLVIRHGTLVTASDTVTADLGIRAGKIAQVGGALPKAKRELDAAGMLVMPGAIDVHTHMEMPFMGTSTADDFLTGTRAAAAGGVTCLIDFAIQPPQTSLLKTLEIWKQKAAGKATIDYSFHLALTHWDDTIPQQVKTLIELGFPSLKVFMAYKGALMLEDAGLLQLLQTSRELGALVMVHAENGDAIFTLQQQALARNETSPRYHALTRPRIAEGEATARAIALAEIAGAPLYVVHVSCQEAMDAIAAARRRKAPIYGEACPQYLGAISIDDYERPDFEGAKFVCSPPLRELDQAKQLWSGLAGNLLQVVSSDHCPFRMEQKRAGFNDFTLIPNGVPGVETLVPLVWTLGVEAGHISSNRFVDLVSTRPARLFGLAPRKGSLTVGADADIMIFDPQREVTLHHTGLHQNLDYTPYEGFRVTGYPATTLSRGDVVWHEGEITAAAGRGELVQRKPFSGD